MTTQYVQKTIGQPVPAWVMKALVVEEASLSGTLDQFNKFEIDPHLAVRMVAESIPAFIFDVKDEVDEHFPPDAEIDVKTYIDVLDDDSPIRTLPDGSRFLCCSIAVYSESKTAYYRLFVQKVTAQPHYRVYIQE